MESGKFFGRCIRHIQGREFGFYDYQYAGGMVIPTHVHRHGLLSFRLAGDYVERFGSKRRSSPQRVVYHPPQEEHNQSFGKTGARIFGFHIPEDLLEHLRDSMVLIHEPCEGVGELDSAAMMRILRLLSTDSPLNVLAAEAAALELLAALPTSRSFAKECRKPKWIAEAQALLDSDKSFSLKLSSVSRAFGLSPGYASREFRRWMGCSIGEYMIRRRVADAFHLIRHSEKSFASIAAEGGFADQSHLSRAIKHATGHTPRALRSDARASNRSKHF